MNAWHNINEPIADERKTGYIELHDVFPSSEDGRLFICCMHLAWARTKVLYFAAWLKLSANLQASGL